MVTLKVLRPALATLIALGFGAGQNAAAFGRQLVVLPRGTTRVVLDTPALAGVSLRAKTSACDAGARLSLAIDGRGVLSTPVSSTRWRGYEARLSLPAGRHELSLSYVAGRPARGWRRYPARRLLPTGRHGVSISYRAGRPERPEFCRHLIHVSDLALVRAIPPSHSGPASLAAGSTAGSPGSAGTTTAAAPGPPATASPWSGDFSTGDLSQWTVLSSDALPGRITVGPAPGVADAYAGRFEIGADDPSPDPTDPDQQRTEVRATQAQSQGYPGSDVWYGWSVYFPDPGFTTPTENPNQTHPQTIFTQWKRTGGHCGSPNAFFEVSSPTHPGFFLGVRGGINQTNQGSSGNCPGTVYNSYRLGDFTPGRWYDFVFHVRWSSDLTLGFVQVWIDGVNVLPRTYEATLYRDWNETTDYGVYLRQGELRKASLGNSSALFIAGTHVGSSYSAVASDFAATNPIG
jgi:hypothetical protein